MSCSQQVESMFACFSTKEGHAQTGEEAAGLGHV